MSQLPTIPPSIFDFLVDLQLNNTRPWFDANRERYESDYRQPALAFIEAMAPRLRSVSRHFVADPRKVGGSLFRIHRDVRFSRDKRPYKTHCGIHFRHEQGKDAHCPGFYLHIGPMECFFGLGIWHPDREVLEEIRRQIDAAPERWRRAKEGRAFRAIFRLGGESLKRAPRGWSMDHPLIEDLRRKDFIAVADLDAGQVLDAHFADRLVTMMKAGAPFMRWLCRTLDLPY